MIRFYQVLLFPFAKPTALMLDIWLGREGIQYLRENDLIAIINAHVESETSEVERLEGVGAINFLAMDDMPVIEEGEPIEEKSIVSLPLINGLPQIPDFVPSPDDPFLQQIHAAGESRVILTDEQQEPVLVLDANNFLRDALLSNKKAFNPYHYCHRPVLVRDPKTPLGDVIMRLKMRNRRSMDQQGIIEKDVILLWSEENKKIITGADILGRLLDDSVDALESE